MTGFSPDWLALREAFDHRARHAGVLAGVSEQFAHLPSVTVVDLGCGTGSTRRALAAHLPRRQHWVLVDNDLGLLARAAADGSSETTRTMPLDLVRDLEAALDGAPDLIATSALLDLVSEAWLSRLVIECAVRRLPLYAALTYDGRVTLAPRDPLDEAVIAAVNRHQLRDKGFGPALGPGAVGALRKNLKAAGYRCREGNSDWIVGPDDCDLQQAMLIAWARAAQEMDVVPAAQLAGWLRRRADFVMAGRASMRVGHRDVLACPIGAR